MMSKDSTKECRENCRLCMDRVIDFIQSRDGRKKIRKVMVPLFMFGAIMMLITGATWARLLNPECGVTLASARFTVATDADTGERVLSGNSCPGYNWKSLSSHVTAGEYNFSFVVSTSPKISKSPIYVGTSNPVRGPIGVALNGVPIYSPSTINKKDALDAESKSVDQCGGMNAPYVEFAYSLPITGYYHYRSLPGQKSPSNAFCQEAQTWYNISKKSHSSIAGFMADGIPIYGPYGARGVVPTDLDNCGGHNSDLPFYHYHFQSKYPYSVNCIKGCADGSMNPQIHSGQCQVDASQVHDYSSLQSMKVVYGGDGVNFTNWAGPACLLTFGFLIFIPSALCCICIGCSKTGTDSHENDRTALADREETDGDIDNDDNIL